MENRIFFYKVNIRKFKTFWEATIGVDFSTAFLKVDGKQIKFQIWDTAGQVTNQPV